MSRTVGKESLDFFAHAASAFLALAVGWALGVYFNRAGALFLAWAYGFVREFTEWQDGGRHPFTIWGILDQLGWLTGGAVFAIAADL